MSPALFRPLVAVLCAGLAVAGLRAAPAEPLQVLHWWTSGSERRAAEVLAERVADAGLRWHDATVPGGAGTGAGKVLRARVLAGDAPHAAQLVGVTLTDVAGMGLLLELDTVAAEQRWAQALFPAVLERLVFRGHVVAAPLGVHRINTLVWHRGLFERLKLAPPTTPDAFEAALKALRAAGVQPLAQSAEPWQVATLFESLVLAEGGPAYHRALFAQRRPEAAADPRLQRALQRLRALKAHMGNGAPADEPWTTTLQRLQRGEAAMMVMGDWAVGELRQAGWRDGVEFGCAPWPRTAGWHLYSIDSLAFFARDFTHTEVQLRAAAVLAQPATQAAYNAVKGSAPVRRDADATTLAPCTRTSWQDFARGEDAQAPSLVHRMATDETSKDALIAAVHRFFTDDALAPAEAQRRWVALYRVLPPPMPTTGEPRP